MYIFVCLFIYKYTYLHTLFIYVCNLNLNKITLANLHAYRRQHCKKWTSSDILPGFSVHFRSSYFIWETPLDGCFWIYQSHVCVCIYLCLFIYKYTYSYTLLIYVCNSNLNKSEAFNEYFNMLKRKPMFCMNILHNWHGQLFGVHCCLFT